MKKFLAVMTGSAAAFEKSGWATMDEASRKQREQRGMEAWSEWVAANAKSIVEQGSPLGKTKRASAQGISDVQNNLAAWVLVQADSHESAVRMFEKHPHFTIFPGEAVEVMECLPIPQR